MNQVSGVVLCPRGQPPEDLGTNTWEAWITPVILFSLFTLVSSSPAPETDSTLETRQTYGACQVTGKGGLDVHCP
ncbi:MAG: hypothetical protein Q9169_003550 [Polycauliona sp. 2 TL-2023]